MCIRDSSESRAISAPIFRTASYRSWPPDRKGWIRAVMRSPTKTPYPVLAGGDFRGGKCRLRSMQANAQFRGYKNITVETQWRVHMTAQLVGTRNSNRMKNAH